MDEPTHSRFFAIVIIIFILVLAVVLTTTTYFIYKGFYKAKGGNNTAPSPSYTYTSPSSTPSVQAVASPPVNTPIISVNAKSINPTLADIQKYLPQYMNLQKKVFLDFDGDGTQEIVAVGTNLNDKVPRQAGSSQGMPLVFVFKYMPQTRQWRGVVEINSSFFPYGNESYISKLTIISFGNKQGLIASHIMSGSRANVRFFAIVGTSSGIQAYPFPEEEYKSRGGNAPQKIDISIDGEVLTKEGIYTGTDANCCPTGGTLEGKFNITPSGINLISLTKAGYNITY